MKKHIVKYVLKDGKFIPDFISDGGYYYNENTLVGVTKEIELEELKKEECCKQIFTKATLASYFKKLNLTDSEGKKLDHKKEVENFYKK